MIEIFCTAISHLYIIYIPKFLQYVSMNFVAKSQQICSDVQKIINCKLVCKQTQPPECNSQSNAQFSNRLVNSELCNKFAILQSVKLSEIGCNKVKCLLYLKLHYLFLSHTFEPEHQRCKNELEVGGLNIRAPKAPSLEHCRRVQGILPHQILKSRTPRKYHFQQV